MDEALTYWTERLDRDGYLDAELILNELFVHADTDGRKCLCVCHPSIGSPAHHGSGPCSCTQSHDERKAATAKWLDEIATDRAAWEASDEGKAERARHDAEASELATWIDNDPGIHISEWGGCFPEQWEGTIDGHSFYFREKRGRWSIELDLEPTGSTYRRAMPAIDPETGEKVLHTVEEPILRGTLIAEGRDTDLGVSPLHHGRFIVHTVRAHLRREGCPHPGARRYCPECGVKIT